MFEKAIENAMPYTHPIVISFRRADGNTGSSIGTFINLNEDGWILTASHIVDSIKLCAKEAASYKEFIQKKSEIQNNSNLTRAKKKSIIKNVSKPISKN